MRSNIERTASGASLPLSTVTSGLPPAAHELVLEAELVEAARNDEVDQVVDRGSTVVEAWREKEHRRPRLPHPEHVLEVDRRERRLARAEDQLAALLDHDARRALDQVRHRAGGDRAERAHRARADHVAVDLRRAARVGRVPVALIVERDRVADRLDQTRDRLVGREPRVVVELGRDDLDPGPRGAEPDLATGGRERLEQARRVRRSRRAGDAEEDAHGAKPTWGPWMPLERRRACAGCPP